MNKTTILALVIAMLLLISNSYAATGKGGATTQTSEESESATAASENSAAGGGADSASASTPANGSNNGGSASATSGTNNVAPTRLCNGIWKPSPGMPWLWEIGVVPSNEVIAASNAQVVDLDMYGTPISTINYIHSLGKAMICYIDTQYEPGRPDSDQFTAALKGGPIDGWPGQYWVDITSPIVRGIMLGRAKLAQSKGCDAIEWDDVDGYANPNGFGTTYAQQIAFNTYLANITHSLGMSVGLKNDVDQILDLVNYFDWALNEQCVEFSECTNYQAFVKQGKAVFGTEYKGTPATFCPTQNAAGYSWLLSDLALDGQGTTECCSFNSPACAKVAYECTAVDGTIVSTFAPGTPAEHSEGLPSAASSVTPAVVAFVVVASLFAALF